MYEGAATLWYVHHYALVAIMKTLLHTGRLFNAQLHIKDRHSYTLLTCIRNNNIRSLNAEKFSLRFKPHSSKRFD